MLNDIEMRNFKEALCAYLIKCNAVRELRIVKISEMSFEYSKSDFGIDYFILYFKIDPLEYVEYVDKIDLLTKNLNESSKLFLQSSDNVALSYVQIIPKLSGPIVKETISNSDKKRVIELLIGIRTIMLSVSTGGPRIQEQNDEFIIKKKELDTILSSFGISDLAEYNDLWNWYRVWSSGKYPTYQSRRDYISTLFSGIEDKIEALQSEELPSVEITGEQRLDRTIREIKYRFSEARNEEQFQAIGVLCRDALISLALLAYSPDKHRVFCDVDPSKTDSKRMIEAFIQGELSGSSNETMRRYAKAANDLANELTHKRTATKKDTVICVNASFSVINMVYALINMIDSTSV
jgi:hypothetical protein